MPVYPLSIGSVAVDQKRDNGTFRTRVLVLADGRLEPAHQDLTRERVDLEGPDGSGDAVAHQIDVDHVVVCCVYSIPWRG